MDALRKMALAAEQSAANAYGGFGEGGESHYEDNHLVGSSSWLPYTTDDISTERSGSWSQRSAHLGIDHMGGYSQQPRSSSLAGTDNHYLPQQSQGALVDAEYRAWAAAGHGGSANEEELIFNVPGQQRTVAPHFTAAMARQRVHDNRVQHRRQLDIAGGVGGGNAGGAYGRGVQQQRSTSGGTLTHSGMRHGVVAVKTASTTTGGPVEVRASAMHTIGRGGSSFNQGAALRSNAGDANGGSGVSTAVPPGGRAPRKAHTSYTPHTLQEYRDHMAATVGVFLTATSGASQAGVTVSSTTTTGGGRGGGGASGHTTRRPSLQTSQTRVHELGGRPGPSPDDTTRLLPAETLILLAKRQARDRAASYGHAAVQSLKQQQLRQQRHQLHIQQHEQQLEPGKEQHPADQSSDSASRDERFAYEQHAHVYHAIDDVNYCRDNDVFAGSGHDVSAAQEPQTQLSSDSVWMDQAEYGPGPTGTASISTPAPATSMSTSSRALGRVLSTPAASTSPYSSSSKVAAAELRTAAAHAGNSESSSASAASGTRPLPVGGGHTYTHGALHTSTYPAHTNARSVSGIGIAASTAAAAITAHAHRGSHAGLAGQQPAQPLLHAMVPIGKGHALDADAQLAELQTRHATMRDNARRALGQR